MPEAFCHRNQGNANNVLALQSDVGFFVYRHAAGYLCNEST